MKDCVAWTMGTCWMTLVTSLSQVPDPVLSQVPDAVPDMFPISTQCWRSHMQTWGQIHLYLKLFKYFFQSICIWPLGMKSICI